MTQLILGDLDQQLSAGLQALARSHGRSVEEEARAILRDAVTAKPEAGVMLGTRLASRFASVGLDDDIEEMRGRQADPLNLEP